jgi:hypothetical protein
MLLSEMRSVRDRTVDENHRDGGDSERSSLDRTWADWLVTLLVQWRTRDVFLQPSIWCLQHSVSLRLQASPGKPPGVGPARGKRLPQPPQVSVHFVIIPLADERDSEQVAVNAIDNTVLADIDPAKRGASEGG